MSTPATAAATESADLVRVSIATGDAVNDLVLPSRLPIAEIIPEVAALTGALDPYQVYGGYQLVLVDGRELDPDASFLAQGVHDGAVVNLVVGADLQSRKVYDDIVEAVADAVEQTGAGWTPQAARVTLLSVAGLLLGLGALVLHLHRAAAATPTLAAAAAVLLLLAGAVFARKVGDLAAAVVTLTAAAAYAVVGALAAAPGATFTTPLLAGGATLFVVGLLATAVLPRRTWTFLPALVLGACGATIGAIVTSTGLPGPRVLAIVVVVATVLGSLIPWLALSSARSLPQPIVAEEQILADPEPIDPERVRAGVRLAHEIHLGLSLSVALLLVLAAPHLVTLGWAGLGVLWAAGLVHVMRTRQFVLAQDVAVGLVGGTVAITVGTVAAVLGRPDWAAVIGLVVAVLSVGVLTGLALPQRTTVRAGRLLDVLESLALFALVPLLAVAVGLLGSVGRG